MLKKIQLILLTFIFFNLFSFAQENQTFTKHIGADLNVHLGYGYGVSMFTKFNKHNIFLGVGIKDIGRELYGYHIGYLYFFKEREKFSLFFESTFAYTPSYAGATTPVGIFYRPIDTEIYFLRKNEWFYYGGIGVGKKIGDVLVLYLSTGVIAGITESKYLNDQRIWRQEDGINFLILPIPYLKIGVEINIKNLN